MKTKNFLDLIEGKNLDGCDKLISDIKNRKNSMTEIIQLIPLEYSKIIYRPDSQRTRILGLKWRLNCTNTSYTDLYRSESLIREYLNVSDVDMFERKLRDVIKYTD